MYTHPKELDKKILYEQNEWEGWAVGDLIQSFQPVPSIHHDGGVLKELKPSLKRGYPRANKVR